MPVNRNSLNTRRAKPLGLGAGVDEPFAWSLDKRLKENMAQIYQQYKEEIQSILTAQNSESEKESELDEEDVKLTLKNAMNVPEGIYEGNWNEETNEREGIGRILYSNGSFYHGYWK